MNSSNNASDITPLTIIDFWFSEKMSKHWFSSTSKIDTEIRDQFIDLWERASRRELDDWKETGMGCLALCIVLDQFPLNMFRGTKKSFATEQQAVSVAKYAIDKGLDEEIRKEQLAFLYMPLMHSEDLADQEQSVQFFEKAGLKHNLRFAKHHRDLIREFGRFPHRNEILGRESTQVEIDYLNSKQAFTG